MPQKDLYGISAIFCRVLAKVKNTTISRKELILLAMTHNNLTQKQASGLIDRNIHFLKNLVHVDKRYLCFLKYFILNNR